MKSGEEAQGQIQHRHRVCYHNRLAPKPRKPMPLAAIVLLDSPSLILPDIMILRRNFCFVRPKIVRAEKLDLPVCKSFQQLRERSLITIPALPVNELSCIATISLPDPDFCGLFFRKCHISSSSTTATESSVGVGFGACICPNFLSHFKSVGGETPNSFAMRRCDRPER